MSGPIATDDTSVTEGQPTPSDGLELLAGREATVGSMRVRRVLPQRARRTVGAWCFADHMGPVANGRGRGGRYRTPPAHRSPNRDLASVRGAPPPRQPRLRATDPSRPAQPDDGRRRGGARRGGHELQGRRAAGSAAVGGTARVDPSRPPGVRTPSRAAARSSSPGREPSSSWASSPVTRLRPRRDTDHLGVELVVQPPGTTLPLTARPRVWIGRTERGSVARRGHWWRSPACSPRSGRGATSAGSRSAPRPAPCSSAASLFPSPSSCGGTSWAAAGTS